VQWRQVLRVSVLIVATAYPFKVGPSVGAARYDPGRRVELSDLLMEADKALYDQKPGGGRRGTTARDLR